MSVGAQMVVVLEAFVEHRVSLVLGHTFECSWLDVSQTDVFHCSSPRSCRLGLEPAVQLSQTFLSLFQVVKRNTS